MKIRLTAVVVIVVGVLQGHAALADTVQAETIQSARLGLVGCYHSNEVANLMCVVAYQRASDVRILIQAQAHPYPFLITDIGPNYVEDASVPLGSLRTFSSTYGPGLELEATTPRTGYVHITSTALHFTNSNGNETCTSYGAFYELESDNLSNVIGFQTTEYGVIGGHEVTGRLCDSYFVGPVSGAWWILNPLDENVPS
ncbi:MAG: hypothetical protein LC750_14335 [Actinobacteria bacterium]|nr:hypothetical protein [Actinomycetota bacterium]